MKLVYFGTSEFAVPALRRLAPSISLVVSQPDRPTGRGMRVQSSPVKLAALELGLPVETPEKCRAPEFVERIRSENADALLVAAYGQILPTSLLESAKFGAINLHGSILPLYRGAAPIQRCIQNGDTETGVTLMKMDKGMDTGDILTISTTAIHPDETYTELHLRLADLAADLAERDLEAVLAGKIQPEAQNHELATYAPKVEKAEAELHFGNSVRDEYNRFRAFTAVPGAFVKTKFGVLKLREVKLTEGPGKPGEVLQIRPELTIAFAGRALKFITVQPEGKAPMPGSAWANGIRLQPGEIVSN